MKPEAESGAVVPMPVDKTEIEALEPYGDLIPFADPSWYQGVRPHSPSPLPLNPDFNQYGINSTTPPTSTKPTLPSATKSANGSPKKSSPMSANGTKPKRSPTKYTRRWEHAGT